MTMLSTKPSQGERAEVPNIYFHQNPRLKNTEFTNWVALPILTTLAESAYLVNSITFNLEFQEKCILNLRCLLSHPEVVL